METESTQTAGDRYHFIRELGRGAMGSVALVHDTVRGHTVAQKHLSNGHAAASLHFKQEFRVLSRLHHDNLVRVYELGHDARGLYFIMEVVHGQPLDEYCRGRDVYAALQHVLPQIVDALVFIHAHGVVHRDLKPSNVLVDASGVVKLLDFGVLGQFASSGADRERLIVVGTPGYMAPEQIRGEPPQPASDLYALGCMLFELLAGLPVFDGTRTGVLQAHLSLEPPRLSDCASAAPPLYDAVCRDLLQKDPSRRPSAHELVQRLLEPLGTRRSVAPRPPHVLGELIGRDALLDELLSRLRDADAPPILALTGPSGVGKSAILEHMARELARDGRLVLRGMARPSERVAYNALDGAIDDLAKHLARHDCADPDVQRAADVARGVFPVLAASGFPTAERCKELVRYRLFGHASAPSRAEVFDSLHQLMLRAAQPDDRVVLVLDDFQWADEDSLALLSHLEGAEHGTPSLIVSLRDDVGQSAAERWLADRRRADRVSVPALDRSALGEIVLRVARAAGISPSEAQIAEAARGAEGRPFLAEVAGRALGAHGQPDLGRMVRESAPLERRLLALLVAADAWTPGPLLARLASCPLGVLDDAITLLQTEGLVRRGGHAGLDGLVDVYHDGVRRVAADALADDVVSAHGALADHWLGVTDAPPERIVRHLLGAGRHQEAAEHAVLAARHAEAQRAFGLAADMYEIALEHAQPDAELLREARARALEKVGRHREAAQAWADLAARAGAERRLDLALCEAHALIAANAIERGIERLDGALVEAGDAPSHVRTVRTLLSAATFVLGPAGRHVRRALGAAGRRRGAPPLPSDVASAQRDVRIGILLAFLDPTTGVRYLLRARDRFASAGARELEAQCDYMFAVLALVGTRHQRVPLADRYVARAEALLGSRRRPREATAMADFVAGLRALRAGRWSAAQSTLDRARAGFEETGSVTERLMSASWSMMADVYRQRVPAIRSHLTWFRRHLRELEGGIISAHVELLEGYLRYLEGDLDGSWNAVTRIVDMYSGRRPNVQRSGALLYRHMADVYRDHGGAARLQFLRSMRDAAPFRLFESMYAGPYAMVGALLEANALRLGERGASPRRLEWFARRMDAAPPLMAGSSDRARAYAADAAGDPERALRLLERAEAVARSHDRALDIEIARFQRGLRIGGTYGAELCASARSALEKVGISERLLYEDAALR